jgi:hypothetical protein
MFKAPPPVGGFDGGKPFELFGKEDEDVGESWPKGPRDQGTTDGVHYPQVIQPQTMS